MGVRGKVSEVDILSLIEIAGNCEMYSSRQNLERTKQSLELSNISRVIVRMRRVGRYPKRQSTQFREVMQQAPRVKREAGSSSRPSGLAR